MAGGKRAGAREKRSFPRRALVPVAGSIVALGLWGYLVWSAIEVGSRARGGESGSWWLTLALTLGAIAALFVCLAFATEAARAIGLIAPATPREQRAPRAPRAPRVPASERPKGGKRAAR